MAKTKALAKYDAELAKYAQAQREAEKTTGGNFISFRGGRLSYKGAEIPGGKMNCIVVHSIHENDFFTEGYDPDNPTSPACYAFGETEEGMAPHEDSSEPQNDVCETCEQNQWPDADAKARGERGKPCKNIRRLALVTESDMEDIESAEIAYAKIPVTSVKGWSGYVRQISDTLNKPSFAVVTEISVVPDNKSQFKVQFDLVQEIDDEVIPALLQLRERIEKEIAFPYPKNVVPVKAVKPAPRAAKPKPTAKAVAPVVAASRKAVAVRANTKY